MTRRCRYRHAVPNPYDADVIRRIRELLALLVRPAPTGPDGVRRDDELLDRLNRG